MAFAATPALRMLASRTLSAGDNPYLAHANPSMMKVWKSYTVRATRLVRPHARVQRTSASWSGLGLPLRDDVARRGAANASFARVTALLRCCARFGGAGTAWSSCMRTPPPRRVPAHTILTALHAVRLDLLPSHAALPLPQYTRNQKIKQLSPFEVDIVGPLFRDLAGKLKHKLEDNFFDVAPAFIFYGALVTTVKSVRASIMLHHRD